MTDGGTGKKQGKSGSREWRIFAWVAFVVVVAIFAAFTYRESRKRIVAKPLFTPLAPADDAPSRSDAPKK